MCGQGMYVTDTLATRVDMLTVKCGEIDWDLYGEGEMTGLGKTGRCGERCRRRTHWVEDK
jgi:hypothetical protein